MADDGNDVIVVGDSCLESEIEKIRSRWELASILNFLTVFEPVIGNDLKLTAEEIETGLVKPDMSLAHLHVNILKGIPPVSRTLSVSGDAWVTALCKKLAMWWPWVAEGELPLKAAKGEEICCYKQLDPTNRLLILKALCEIRAEQDDIASYVNGSLKDGTEISYFRKDKIGGDGTATAYWYDGSSVVGHRLYKEVNKTEANVKRKGKASKNLPPICCQWKILATNFEEFQKAVIELSSSKVATEVAAGKNIEADILPIIEKFRKKKERDLKKKQRQEMLLNSFRSYNTGITRSCRSRGHISYTFDEYDRAIDEAINLPMKRKTSKEQSNGRKHVKQEKNASDGGSNIGTDLTESVGKNGDSDMSADSEDRNMKKANLECENETDQVHEANGDDNLESENESDKPHVTDDDNLEFENESDKLRKADDNDADDDSDDDYDFKRDVENDNVSGSGNSDKEAELGAMNHVRKRFGSRWSIRLAGMTSHPLVETRNVGTKNWLRQRPTRNSALDSIVLDSDGETS